ncbi:seminase [Drosophila serrata]|uniref:seminase n=1 Tax=Drosophila serrata TaxID=7274 RepID=UPI000A1D03E9|nr:seminase [Drosophila serrata]
MLTNWLLFASLFLLTSSGIDAEASALMIQPRIYGGQKTSNSDIGGFGVQIFYKNKLVCTGVLISSRHLITAAHCFENMAQSDFHVVAGTSLEAVALTRSEKKNGLVEVRLHPKFDKLKFIADIAVVKTQYPLKGRTIGYAKLCKYPLYNGDRVTVAGWGTDGTRRSSDERQYLQTMQSSIVGHKQCEKKLGRKMPPNILCAGEYNHQTLCTGDSGGPLIWQDEVCGISTWTWKCGDNEKPDVFMSVRHYAKFITSTINEMGY